MNDFDDEVSFEDVYSTLSGQEGFSEGFWASVRGESYNSNPYAMGTRIPAENEAYDAWNAGWEQGTVDPDGTCMWMNGMTVEEFLEAEENGTL